MSATQITPDPHTPSRAESLMRIARLAQPGSAPPFEAGVSLLTAFVLLCRQEDQDPVTTASWLLPVITATVDTHLASQTAQAEAASAIPHGAN
ncbi:hypothetical protein [Pannonibacter sp. SL95]|uniref:hypothetical protein n=1 Tax=Pannonibacter sp. SL95 TaxID=2995153 RepID=UPI002275E3DE|nr:hypothetical protein [Pannonibacter sp. SL95]MCY1704516.1 hypothetical protein [Pannonibacter sp. SL95]MCY1707297.1 hypothetical protein [Pannonibacter sp. SL95]MCY1709022.1 hypothetical protein [Pannonibacter sp. SL95]